MVGRITQSACHSWEAHSSSDAERSSNPTSTSGRSFAPKQSSFKSSGASSRRKSVRFNGTEQSANDSKAGPRLVTKGIEKPDIGSGIKVSGARLSRNRPLSEIFCILELWLATGRDQGSRKAEKLNCERQVLPLSAYTPSTDIRNSSKKERQASPPTFLTVFEDLSMASRQENPRQALKPYSPYHPWLSCPKNIPIVTAAKYVLSASRLLALQ